MCLLHFDTFNFRTQLGFDCEPSNTVFAFDVNSSERSSPSTSAFTSSVTSMDSISSASGVRIPHLHFCNDQQQVPLLYQQATYLLRPWRHLSTIKFFFLHWCLSSSPCSPSSISFSSSSSSSSSECSSFFEFLGCFVTFNSNRNSSILLGFLCSIGAFFLVTLNHWSTKVFYITVNLRTFFWCNGAFLGASCIPSSSSAATSASKSSIVLSSSDIWEFSLMLISLYYIYTITVFEKFCESQCLVIRIS